jgi:hypothetical protein
MKIATFGKCLLTACESRYTSCSLPERMRNLPRTTVTILVWWTALKRRSIKEVLHSELFVFFGMKVIFASEKTEGASGEAVDGAEERAALGLYTVVLLDCHHDYGFRLEDCRIDDRMLYPSRFGQSKERWRQVLCVEAF